MSIYRPEQLPFWEIERGHGPITKHLKMLSEVKERKAKLGPIYSKIYRTPRYKTYSPLAESLTDGNRWVSRGRP